MDELTEKQNQACCSDALTTLVLAGAGTGKTSTLLGRLVYLWEKQQAKHVLSLAFAVDAAQEIQHRMEQILPRLNTATQLLDFKARTFHSLGLYIVTQVERVYPRLSHLSEEPALKAFLKNKFLQRSEHQLSYRQAIYHYFTYTETQIKQHTTLYRSLNDDYVLNHGELVLANVFYALNIPYIYHAHYVQDMPNPLEKAKHSRQHPYRCSFYLPESKIFIEVLPKLHPSQENITKLQGRLPTEKNISQEQDISKEENILRHLHTQYGTTCLVYTDSFTLDFRLFDVDLHKQPTHSPARMDDLFDVLWSIFIEAKKQAWTLEQMRVFLETRKQPTYGQARESSLLYDLIAPLYEDYLHTQQQEIDFEHMILRATQYIREGKFQVPWSDVLIDEFQDISATRLALIQAMREQKPDLTLFCVGDDWQTIYQFAGSQLIFIRQIEAFFGKTRIITLDKTFRFHQGLCRISSTFVQQNPLQYKKQLSAFRKEQESLVLVEYQEQNYTERYQLKHQDMVSIQPMIIAIFRDIQQSLYPPSKKKQRFQRLFLSMFSQLKEEEGNTEPLTLPLKTCLFLARFSHDLPAPELLGQWQHEFPFLQLRASTIHAAKGTEADYVVILNVNAGEYGLPSEKEDLLYQLHLKQEDEYFPFAQERRVFYVALTRAKERVYLCYDTENASLFVKELKQQARPQSLRRLPLFHR